MKAGRILSSLLDATAFSLMTALACGAAFALGLAPPILHASVTAPSAPLAVTMLSSAAALLFVPLIGGFYAVPGIFLTSFFLCGLRHQTKLVFTLVASLLGIAAAGLTLRLAFGAEAFAAHGKAAPSLSLTLALGLALVAYVWMSLRWVRKD